jgi:hypothetical protein
MDDDVKILSTTFWKYLSSFRKHNSYVIYLDVNGTNVVEPVKVTEGFKTLPLCL